MLSAKYQPFCHSLNVLNFTGKPEDINHMNMVIAYFITACVTSISPSNILMLPNNIMLGNMIILRSHAVYCSADTSTPSILHFDGLVQERRNSSALAMELPLSWWRHQMETFSALLPICAGNSPVPGEFPTQRPVTRSFDVFFQLCLIKRLRKQSRGWWLETLSFPLWRHRNVLALTHRFAIWPITFQTYLNNFSQKLLTFLGLGMPYGNIP